MREYKTRTSCPLRLPDVMGMGDLSEEVLFLLLAQRVLYQWLLLLASARAQFQEVSLRAIRFAATPF